MLKKETVQKIESLLKIKDLEAAIKDEKEVDVTLDDKLSVMSETELTTLKNNEYANGKKAGAEMEVKAIKEELQLDFQGKTVKGLIEAAQKKALEDAKIEPAQKVKELTADLEKVRGEYKKLETVITEKDGEVTKAKTDRELFQHIPKFGENGPSLTNDEFLSLMRANGYDFKFEDGKLVPYKGTESVKDKMSAVREVKDVIAEFAREKKLVAEETAFGGRGGKDQKSVAKYGKLSELEAKFKAEGKNVQGDEFREAYEQAVKDNPDFKLDQ